MPIRRALLSLAVLAIVVPALAQLLTQLRVEWGDTQAGGVAWRVRLNGTPVATIPLSQVTPLAAPPALHRVADPPIAAVPGQVLTLEMQTVLDSGNWSDPSNPVTVPPPTSTPTATPSSTATSSPTATSTATSTSTSSPTTTATRTSTPTVTATPSPSPIPTIGAPILIRIGVVAPPQTTVIVTVGTPAPTP